MTELKYYCDSCKKEIVGRYFHLETRLKDIHGIACGNRQLEKRVILHEECISKEVREELKKYD